MKRLIGCSISVLVLLMVSCVKDNPISSRTGEVTNSLAKSLASAADVNTGLVAYYPFNGNANDESGNAHHGLVQGANLTIDKCGTVNSAYSFNGINNNIILSNTSGMNMLSGFSLATWVNFTSSNAGSSIVSKHQNYSANSFTLSSEYGKIFLYTDNDLSSVSTNNAYNDGKWHFIVGTFNGSTSSLYIDGYLVSSGPTFYTTGSDENIKLGSDTDISFFDGKIDDVRIYNRPLTQDEVQALYNESNCNNLPPDAQFTYLPESPTTSEPVSFDASSSIDQDGNITSYSWNYGDGSTGTGMMSSHQFTTAADYTVTLTVTDDDGATATCSKFLSVNEKPTLTILNSEMVSKNELGIDVKVKFPSSAADDIRTVNISTQINGKSISKVFDVTSSTIPEQEITLNLKIDLATKGVKRFNDDIRYTLEAYAKGTSCGQSSTDSKNAKILLPLIIVAGLWNETANMGSKSEGIIAFKNFLISSLGYSEDITKYRTIWIKSYKSVVDGCEEAARQLMNNEYRYATSKKLTYADKINIIGFSQGGLVARAAISFPKYRLEANKCILIATPNEGSTCAFFLFAYDINKNGHEYQGHLDLLPTYEYIYIDGILNTKLQKGPLKNKFLLKLNSLPNNSNTRYFSIYNSGISLYPFTPNTINVTFSSNGLSNLGWTFRGNGPGDGVVLESSAKWEGADFYDIQQSDRNGMHDVLLSNSIVQKLTKGILQQ